VNPRRPIRKLSKTVASQIAAGEVVERPASVVKELVENSIDAGATRVRIELEAGGIELIRVSDDGKGISPEELPLAIEAHATSKIETTADLDRIATMGFRGEALASIASVARVSIRSRTAEDQGASEIRVNAGDAEAIRPASGPVGTTIEVRNLFYATPARRKFLKTPQTERSRCLNALREIAMASPAIGFVIATESKTLLDLPPGQDPKTRALAVIGKELEAQMLEVSADEFDDARGIALWGLVGLPAIARPTAIAQHVFVNGRPVRDRTIQHAIKEAYRGLMEHSRYPTAVLMLEMSPEAVDVNVHPAKAEVRFRDSGHVHSVVHRAVKDALRKADLTPMVGSFGRSVSPMDSLLGAGTPVQSAGVDQPRPASEEERLVSFFREDVPRATQGRISYESLRAAMEPVAREEHREPEPTGGTEHAEQTPAADPGSARAFEAKPMGHLQVHQSYVVTQDDEGVVIVDQHALHERVMFEYLMERLGRGPLESQALLVPEVIEVSPAQLAALDTLGELLQAIGIEAREMGPTSVGVSAFPSFLFDRGVEIQPFLNDLLELAVQSAVPPTSEEALRDVVDMMSCKAAVKAGDKLSSDELNRLMQLRDEVERSSSCPHGRPTSIRLTLTDLEKLFHRR
jgi:DNA mismatch repair protein MutL